MSRREPVAVGIVFGLAVGIVASVVVVQLTTAGADAARSIAGPVSKAVSPIVGAPYEGDPKREAAVVESESERLVAVRRAAASAQWDPAAQPGAFRLGADSLSAGGPGVDSLGADTLGADTLGAGGLGSGDAGTLVLTARAAPYTVADLQALSPATVVAQPDGSVLLSDSVAVMTGATLALAPAGVPANVTPAGVPANVADPAGAGDSPTPPPAALAPSVPGLTLHLESDARRFVSIVVLGGALEVHGTAASQVSFDSQNPVTGRRDTTTDDGRAYVRVVGGSARLEHTNFDSLGFWSGNTGGLALTGTEADEPSAADAAGVSATLDSVTSTGNAFGLFVTGADGLTVRDSAFTDSLVDGVVFHRYVTRSTVTRTTAANNAVDGFVVGRSSTGVSFTAVTARANGRNGISLAGEPLAAGPSATGTKVTGYGDNHVRGARIIGNARYGVDVSGGANTSVTASEIADNRVGLVAGHAADGVAVSDNVFDNQTLQAVALRDSVTNGTVTGNRIAGGETGIYLRNAAAAVRANTIESVTNHGVTLVGAVGAATVARNEIAGSGSIPIFAKDSRGATVAGNDTSQWRPAVTVYTVIRSIFQPLTVVWILLGLVILATAILPVGRRRAAIRHPFADRVPLSTFTRGIVSRESISEVHQ